MRNFSKNIKNIFAKLNILPFIFCCFFLLVTACTLINFQSNQSKNVPQENLNYSQAYLNYLQLSEEEKQEFLIPRKYEIEFENIYQSPAYLSLDESSLPTEFSLYKLNSFINKFTLANANSYENLKYNIGNQYGAGICWSFATMASLESSIYKSGLVPNGEVLNFSEMHMAYTSQVVNRSNDFANVDGGIFELAMEYLSSEQGPVNEQENENYALNNANNSYWVNDSTVTNYYKQNYLSTAEHSGYSVLESYSFPSSLTIRTSEELTVEQKEQQILILRNSIKSHIKEYGAVTASIYYYGGNFISTSNGPVYYNKNQISSNHMVALVGWDDDYTYTEKINGENITHTGAYIAQNSHGSDYGLGGFFYILYDDILVENNVNGFVRIGNTLDDSIKYNNMSGLESDGEFITMIEENGEKYFSFSWYGIGTPVVMSNIYQRSEIDNQYVSRLKVPTLCVENTTEFYVYILDGLTEDDVVTETTLKGNLKSKFSNARRVKNKNSNSGDDYLFVSNQTTYYTIDIPKEDYFSLTGDFFAIYILYNSGEIVSIKNIEETESFQPYNYSYYSCMYSDTPIQFSKRPYEVVNGYDYVMPMIVETQYQLGNIEYTVENYSGNYDGSAKTINIDVTTPDSTIYYRLSESDAWTTTHPVIKNAGNYNVYYKIEADCYSTVTGYATINIQKKDLIITPRENQYIIYGESAPSIGYKYAGSIAGETPSFGGKISVEYDVLNVGKYSYTSTFYLKDNSQFIANNYNLVFNTLNDSQEVITFEVKPRTLYITPILTSKIYGEADMVINYNYSNVHAEEIPLFSGVLLREQGENVGFYNVVNNLSLLDNIESGFLKGNYVIELIDFENKFEITKRTLTVNPYGEYFKPYTQEQDPTFMYNYSGNKEGEEPTFTGALSREPGNSVGSYAITLGTLSIQNNGNFLVSNYNMVLSSNTVYLLIIDSELQNCALNSLSVTYDSNFYTLTPACDTEGVMYKYSTDGIDWKDEQISYKDVGTYTIFVKFYKENYANVVLSNNLTISAKILTVTPDSNQTFVYGDEINLTYTYAGNVANETPKFIGSLIVDNTNVGDREIQTAENFVLTSNENFKVSNYMLSFTRNITAKITPRTIFVKPTENQFKVYDGTNDTPNLTFVFDNVANEEIVTYTGSLQREIGIDVGEYNYSIQNITLINSIDETFKAGNYNLELVAEDNKFSIIPADITVTAEDKSSYYSDEIITQFTYAVEGDYVAGDNLNVTYSCEVNNQTKKGEYKIEIFANNSNYNITLVNGTYTINYKTYKVEFVLKISESSPVETLLEIEVEHFSKVDKEVIPVININGYTLEKWVDVNSAEVDFDNHKIESDTIFYARMSPIKYIIEYNLNGGQLGENVKNEFYIYSETFELPTPTKEGYSFVAWYLYSNFVGDEVTYIEKGTSSNIKLYAKWEIDTLKVTLPEIAGCEILCDSDIVNYDGTFVFGVELTEAYNQSYENLQVFVKWKYVSNNEELFKNLDGLYQVDNVKTNFEIIIENVEINTYIINFIADDKIVSSIEKNHGDSLLENELPEIPMENKEHYNKQQPYWEINSLENITEEKNINAVYIPNIYTVTFKMQDGEEFYATVNYGETVNYDILKDNYILNMFEYFDFDSSINNISEDCVINVTIKSNIHILYISLACLGAFIVLIIIIRIVKKIRRRKFNWWNYATPPKK